LGFKASKKAIADLKAVGGFREAVKIELASPEHQAKLDKIETRKIANIAKANAFGEALEIKQFGELGLSYWEKQKMIFSGRIFRKDKKKK